MDNKIKVGVIYGGQSFEHEVSKMTAQSILKNIDRDKFAVTEIYIDENGRFDETLLRNIDVAFLAVHGPNCEDGKLQQLLEENGIRYTGSGVEASRINMDKYFAHKIFAENDLPVVEFENFSQNDLSLARDFVDKIGLPVFIKPNNGGSSVGMTKVENIEDFDLAMERAFSFYTEIIIEKAVPRPREIEIGILGNSDLIISNPGEILTNGEFYSYECKYKNPFKTTVKTSLSNDMAKKIQDLAKKAYRVTGCQGYARVDFLLEKDKIYLNEINTLPGFTATSMFPELMAEVGINYKELITRIIKLALV